MAEQTISRITTGQYQFGLVVEPSEKVAAAVLELGYKVAIQSALMEWERRMAYPTVDGKKMKRPASFKRKDIPFTKEGADLLAKLVGAVQIDVSPAEAEKEELVDIGIMDVTAPTLYEGTTYEPKYKMAKENINAYLFEADGKTPKKTKEGEVRTVEMLCSLKGFTAPSEPWEEDTAFLQEVTEFLKNVF